MKCKDIEEKIILDIYGELEESEKVKLYDHLDSCQVCQAGFKEIMSLFNTLESEVENDIQPRWGYYWGNILNRIRPEKTRKKFARISPRWGVTFAGFVLCLILGFFIGKIFLQPPQQKKSTGVFKGRMNYQMVLGDYFEDMKPIMVDLANSDFSEKPAKEGPVDKEIIASMLMQTRLLRRRLSDQDDPYLKGLLSDMELILMEIDNINPGDKSAIQLVQDEIKKKGIPIKIELFKHKTKKI